MVCSMVSGVGRCPGNAVRTLCYEEQWSTEDELVMSVTGQETMFRGRSKSQVWSNGAVEVVGGGGWIVKGCRRLLTHVIFHLWSRVECHTSRTSPPSCSPLLLTLHLPLTLASFAALVHVWAPPPMTSYWSTNLESQPSLTSFPISVTLVLLP
jgi:hypothetical protein